MNNIDKGLAVVIISLFVFLFGICLNLKWIFLLGVVGLFTSLAYEFEMFSFDFLKGKKDEGNSEEE